MLPLLHLLRTYIPMLKNLSVKSTCLVFSGPNIYEKLLISLDQHPMFSPEPQVTVLTVPSAARPSAL